LIFDAGVARRRQAKRSLAHAVEMAHEGVPLTSRWSSFNASSDADLGLKLIS